MHRARATSPESMKSAGGCRSGSWGKGIAKEAAIASMDLAFDRFDAPQVIATTVPANVASQGLMKRLGMNRREELDYVDTRFGPETQSDDRLFIESRRMA